jgi:hypothetical protein
MTATQVVSAQMTQLVHKVLALFALYALFGDLGVFRRLLLLLLRNLLQPGQRCVIRPSTSITSPSAAQWATLHRAVTR